jgi:hypothetical protein
MSFPIQKMSLPIQNKSVIAGRTAARTVRLKRAHKKKRMASVPFNSFQHFHS